MDESAEPTRDLTKPPKAPPAKFTQQLQSGDVLGGRFVIVRFLARGGMGEVYEAEDRELRGKHIALKTIRPKPVVDLAASDSLEHEVLMAREVSHPNVCPTYDLFRVDGPRGPVVFLTMKLLRGESLSARLRRVKRLGPDEVLPLARQMADALDAAHRFGVIHRDFKSANVMLTGSAREPTVSITDFGLARLHESDVTLAEAQLLSGTPGYMAPELYQGTPASPASDVFAFGVVLREMLTGQRSEGQLPSAWADVIQGCLKEDPADRFQSAGEALRALKDPAPRVELSRRAAAGIGLGVVGAVAWFGWPSIESSLHPLPDKRFVALIAWPGEPAEQVRAILTNILDAIAARLVRAESVVKNLLVIRPSDVSRQITIEPRQVVSLLGANLVLAASLQPVQDGLDLRLRILEAATGRTLRDRSLSVPSAEARQLPERASAAAASLLQVAGVKAAGNRGDGLERISPVAYQDFALAEELRQQPNDVNLDQAITHYQQALDADPTFALGYARIAMAYIRKFQIAHVPAALSLAQRNSGRAVQLNPDLAQSVLSRALVDLYAGKTQEAMDAMSRAQRIDPGNAEILMYEARAFGDLGKNVEEEASYRSVLEQRPNFWPAYNELGRVLYRQGKLEEALKAFQEACTVAPQVALPFANAGSICLRLGRRNDAIEMFQKSLRAAPNELAYLNLGGMAFEDRAYAKALDYYEKARDLNPRSDTTFRNIGDCYDAMGKTTLVKENYARAADLMLDELKTNPRRGSAWMRLAFYDAKAGRRERVDADIKAAEDRGADDVLSQFMKAQAVAVMGRKEEAAQLVLRCLDRGLSPVDVELALDLKEVRADPRYRKRAGKVQPAQ